MLLFYTPDVQGDAYTLNNEESRHLVRVLRKTRGDQVHLTDGRGGLFRTRIVEDNPGNCTVAIEETMRRPFRKPYRVHIGIAPTKNINRFEWFLEKATEIGIDSVIPFVSENSERKNIKPERLEKIIIAAMKQSLKVFKPRLHELTSFHSLIQRSFRGGKYIAWIDDHVKHRFYDACPPGEDALILIGPEGDFTPAETGEAKKYGFIPISLGDSRLRTETAGIVACHTVALRNEGVR